MLKLLKYLWMPLLLFAGCESVYEPELDEVESVLVVDARLDFGESTHQIILQKSVGFNEPDLFEPYANALVQLIDSRGKGYLTQQIQPGLYELNESLDSTESYRLYINAGGETFTSGLETVPQAPHISAFYSGESEKWTQPGGETDVDEFRKKLGHQVYVDINNYNAPGYYRFDARKIMQYQFPFDTIMDGALTQQYKFGWKSIYPDDIFNIAGPNDYASELNIIKHPVEFFPYQAGRTDSGESEVGWIYIMYQYSISQSAWKFYNDLNSQLGADGKIFDPMYVQARSNLKCVSNPKKVVLGNFEISRFREHRFFVKPDPRTGIHTLRRITVFHDIPESGIKSLYPPWFWQN
jgi:hypothetical protein